MASESGSDLQPGILNCQIADKAELYTAYMPFVTNGGLFIAAKKGEADRHGLGDEVFLLLNLRDQGERIPIPGKVIWVTPSGAQGQRPPGLGIQFSAQDGGGTQKKIETILAGGLSSDRPTKTM